MYKYFPLIAVLIGGCAENSDVKIQYQIDVVIQNMGADTINRTWIEFDSGDKVIGGKLISGAQATQHEIPASVSQQSMVVVEREGNRQVYQVDMGMEAFGKLSSGYHILYFQLNPEEKKVLFRCFDDEFPHDILFSGKKLEGAIRAAFLGDKDTETISQENSP